jgi:hypothetical protein
MAILIYKDNVHLGMQPDEAPVFIKETCLQHDIYRARRGTLISLMRKRSLTVSRIAAEIRRLMKIDPTRKALIVTFRKEGDPHIGG